MPCWRSSRRVAVKVASSAADQSSSVLVSPQTWLEVRPRSRSTARNGWPLYIASRSFCRISAGSRFCARARPRALAASFWASRHRSQSQPSSQRAVRHIRATVRSKLPGLLFVFSCWRVPSIPVPHSLLDPLYHRPAVRRAGCIAALTTSTLPAL